MAVAALPSAPALARRRSVVLDFSRQQPLGAASFVIISSALGFCILQVL